MKKYKLIIFCSFLFFMSNFSDLFVTNANAGLFSGFYRKNGLVNGSEKYKDKHNDPEEPAVRVTANHRTLKRNTLNEPPLKRGNFYKKDGLVNGDQQYKDRHLTEDPVTSIVYSKGGMVKSRVTVGYATNKRLKPISSGGFFDIFRFSSKHSTRQTVDSPR